MLWGMMSYCAKLTGEDLSHYFNKIESVGERLSVSAGNDIKLSRLTHDISLLPPRTAGTGLGLAYTNEEITPLSSYV